MESKTENGSVTIIMNIAENILTQFTHITYYPQILFSNQEPTLKNFPQTLKGILQTPNECGCRVWRRVRNLSRTSQ